MRLKREVEAGAALKKQASLGAIRLAADSDNGGHESEHGEFLLELICVPDLAVLSFEKFSASRFGVDLGHEFTADGFSWIGHAVLLDRVVDLNHTDQAGV